MAHCIATHLRQFVSCLDLITARTQNAELSLHFAICLGKMRFAHDDGGISALDAKIYTVELVGQLVDKNLT